MTTGTSEPTLGANNVFSAIADGFRRNVESVYQLAEFDHVVLDFAIHTLETIQERAKAAKVTSYLLSVDKSLQQFQTIRTNDSLRSQYQHIFNQCVVLLVSYFGSAVRDLFSAGVTQRLTSNPTEELLEEELKLTVSELVDVNGEIHERVAGLLMRKGDISFQDMQSMGKAFEKYCGHKPEKDQDCNNIILGQACRHVIVHSGAIVDEKCLRQVKSAMPRTLKLDLAEGQVQFNVEELRVLGTSMLAYVAKLMKALTEHKPKV